MIVIEPEVLLDAELVEERGFSAQRWLWASVVIVALLVCGYRNDLFSRLAESIGLNDALLSAERSAIGGPAFGTVRSVRMLVKQHPVDVSEVRLPVYVSLGESK